MVEEGRLASRIGNGVGARACGLGWGVFHLRVKLLDLREDRPPRSPERSLTGKKNFLSHTKRPKN